MDEYMDLELLFPPTEKQLKEMKEKEQLRLQEIERLERLKNEEILKQRLEMEEKKVRQIIKQDKKRISAEESKKRKKALQEARRQIIYPQLQEFEEFTAYELESNRLHSKLFTSKHDAIYQGIIDLKKGYRVKIEEIIKEPNSESLNRLSKDDMSDLCPFCGNICVVVRSDDLNRFQNIVKKNHEISKNNNDLLKEYIDELDMKTKEILEEMNAKDESNKQ